MSEAGLLEYNFSDEIKISINSSMTMGRLSCPIWALVSWELADESSIPIRLLSF